MTDRAEIPFQTRPFGYRHVNIVEILRTQLVVVMGVLLFVLIALGAVFPALIFKDLTGFAVIGGTLIAACFGPASPPAADRSYLMLANWCFVIYGAFIAAISFTGIFDIDKELPFRSDYVVRQAYFLIFWIPFFKGAGHFWTICLDSVISLCRRFGIPILIVLALADLVTAKLWGDPRVVEWQGYTFYMEKFSFQFLFALVYMTYVTFSSRVLLGIGLITVYAGLSTVLQLGINFNANTGKILYLMLLIGSLPFLRFRTRGILLVLLYVAIVANVINGFFFPELYTQKEDNTWRLAAWSSNIKDLWDSNMFGLGFGTPYFPFTAENLANTLKNNFDSVTVVTKDPFEIQYIRGQHSSVLNVFYRMGLLGGIIFLVLNGLILRAAFRGLRQKSIDGRRATLVALILFMTQLLQMTVHVGIETPRFLVIYALSAAFVIEASLVSRNALVRSGGASLGLPGGLSGSPSYGRRS